MILNQEQRSNCWIWACMAILQHAGVKFDISTFSELKAPYAPIIEKIFIDSGLVIQFVKLPNTKLVDIWLNKWEYILTGTPRGDFSLDNNDGWLVDFDEKSQHWFVIVENCWDRYKLQNSWWEEYWEKGYMYMKKSDFSKLFTPKRLVFR